MAELIQPVKGMNDVLPEQAPWWEPARSRRARAVRGLRVPARPASRPRAHRVVQPLDRRAHGHRLEGDVHVRRPRGQPHASARGDGQRRARRVEQRPVAQSAAEALVLGADVPARETAKGTLPAVPPDERRSARLRRARDRCRAIALSARLWRGLGSRARKLELNTIGTAESRHQYKQVLVEHFGRHRELLDEDSLRRLERNPLRILDSKNPALRQLIDGGAAARRLISTPIRARTSSACKPCSKTSVSRTR